MKSNTTRAQRQERHCAVSNRFNKPLSVKVKYICAKNNIYK